MNGYVAILSVLAATASGQVLEVRPAGYGKTTIVRAPAHDSASIESHRLGGNFAYSTAEAHAFAKTTEQLSTAIHPVAETTHTHVPAPIAHVQPAPIVETTYAAKPIIGSRPVIAHQPVVGPVAQHTKVTQPIFKTQQVVATPPQVAYANIATPVAAVAAAPAIAAAPIAAAPALAYNGYAAGAPALGYNGAIAYNGAYAAAPIAAGHLAAAPIAAKY